MAIIKPNGQEIDCKIVFYGPSRCGKTSNFRYISEAFKKQIVGQIVSIKTDCDRTLFFDFIPIGLGRIDGFNVRVRLYTIPGQIRYKSTRKLLLRGVDGIVFVADSLEVRRQENILALQDLMENLRDVDEEISDMPLVFQYNKRDLEGGSIPIMSVEEMETDLNLELKAPYILANAAKGEGVGQTLKECLKLMWPSLKKKLRTAEKGPHGKGER